MDNKNSDSSAASFSHITINSAEPDEVIVAGIVDQDIDLPDSPEPVECETLEQRPSKPAYPDASPKKNGDYQETTLEDLQAQPLSITHKAVIAFAIILIIGFAVYWFAIR